MEEQLDLLSSILNTLDAKGESCESLNTFNLPEIIHHLCETLSNQNSFKLLRQLLTHAESSVLEIFFSNPSLPEQILHHIINNKKNDDSIKLFTEIFDESLHSTLINPEFIDDLVNALGTSSSETCENIIKTLILVARNYLNWILAAKNSRFFGEGLVFRVNWAEGTEKRNLIITICNVLKICPGFFYLNDLRVVADTLIKVLIDREEGVLKESYDALQEMMKIEEFYLLGYRFAELAEVLQHSEDDLEICEIQCNLLVKVENFNLVR